MEHTLYVGQTDKPITILVKRLESLDNFIFGQQNGIITAAKVITIITFTEFFEFFEFVNVVIGRQ